jgi:hypothetical protein
LASSCISGGSRCGSHGSNVEQLTMQLTGPIHTAMVGLQYGYMHACSAVQGVDVRQHLQLAGLLDT